MKGKLGAYGMFMALAMTDFGTTGRRDYEPKESDESKMRRLARAEIERNKANGLTEFFYGENSVWAINQKNADKKAKIKGYI